MIRTRASLILSSFTLGLASFALTSSFVTNSLSGSQAVIAGLRSSWPPPPESIINLDDLVNEGRFTGLSLVAEDTLTLYTVPADKRLVLCDASIQGSPNGQDCRFLSLRQDDGGTVTKKLSFGFITSGWDGVNSYTSGSTGYHSSLGVVFEAGTNVVLHQLLGTVTELTVESFNGYLVDA